jgi:hypothetical protein
MKHRLFTILSAVSLLLCVATCVLWVRSYWLSDQLAWGYRSIESAQGYVMLGISRFSGLDGSVRNDSHAMRYARRPAHAKYPDWETSIIFLEGLINHDTGERNFGWERGGFAWYENRERNGDLNAVGFAPFCCFAGATALLPLGWTITLWSRRRRRKAGFCFYCGYDLRATPERCPECGMWHGRLAHVRGAGERDA